MKLLECYLIIGSIIISLSNRMVVILLPFPFQNQLSSKISLLIYLFPCSIFQLWDISRFATTVWRGGFLLYLIWQSKALMFTYTWGKVLGRNTNDICESLWHYKIEFDIVRKVRIRQEWCCFEFLGFYI